MTKLVINNADGSHYWTEHFNSQDEANAWLAEEKTRPYWDATRTHEFIPTIEFELSEQEIINSEALAYLQSTDWYVIRFADSGEPIPDDVKAKRSEARARIVR